MSAAGLMVPAGVDPWGLATGSDRNFRQILCGLVIFVTALGVVSRQISTLVSEPEVTEKPVYFIELRADPEPEIASMPEPEPVVEPDPAPVEPPPEAPPQPASKPAPVAAKAAQAMARAAAEEVGIFSSRQQLSQLRDANNTMLGDTSRLQRLSEEKPARNDSAADVIASASMSGSGSFVAASGDVHRQQHTRELADHVTQEVESRQIVGDQAGRSDSSLAGKAVEMARSLDEIQLAFNRSKGAFYSIFNRAARRDASIKAGHVIVSLTISPAGQVTDCSLVSSSFRNAQLERKLLQRVKLLKFEAREVPVFTYPNYPINYVPS